MLVALVVLLTGASALWAWTGAGGPGDPAPTPVSSPTGTLSPGTDPEVDPAPDPSPTPEPLPDAEFTIGAVGDVIPHDTVVRNARTADGYDFTRLLQPTRAWSEGVDLALCNLETPLLPPDQEPSGYPLFGAPEELAHDLADLGWDGCSTANNHTLDRGLDNVVHTLDVLDEAGMGHAGSARSSAEGEAAQVYELQRSGQTIRIAQIAATDSTNGLPIPAGAPWAVTMLDTQDLIDRATRARQDGADLVVASLHWGAEYVSQPGAEQEAIAQELADSGQIDLIIGNHSHVPQPFDLLDGGPDGTGMWVAYSLGNFISNQDELCCVPQTATGLFMTASVVKPDGEAARVTGLEWTAMTVDRLGSQRVHPLHPLVSGDHPEDLALSTEQIQRRDTMVREVMEPTGFPERTQPPAPTGDRAVVIPRSD